MLLPGFDRHEVFDDATCPYRSGVVTLFLQDVPIVVNFAKPAVHYRGKPWVDTPAQEP
jgi:hypothetical protein